MAETFTALLLEREGAGEGVRAAIRELGKDALPAGEVLVRVEYSSLNYKDALAVTNRGRIVREYPMVPGIDFAGTVAESASPAYRPGDPVVLTGWGAGERHWGGFAGLARVPADWLVPLPAGLTARRAMALGTAGFTAMLCVLALEERGLAPGAGGREVAVTGAGGGVGGVAIALLARGGHDVTAVTGRAELGDYLRALGARRVIGREELPLASTRPLESERWGGAIDPVGGDTLAALLRQMAYYSSVAACGLAAGSALSTTMIPFILRAVSLVGVESVTVPGERRRAAWARLARDLPPDLLDRLARTIALGAVPHFSEELLAGRVRGRLVVDVSG